MASWNYKGGRDGENLIRHLCSLDQIEDSDSEEEGIWILDRGFATDRKNRHLYAMI